MFTILNFFFFITAKSNLTWIVVGGGRRALLVRSFVRLLMLMIVTRFVSQSMGTLVPRGVLGMHAFS